MRIFLISYDLSKPEQDYAGLIEAIERYSDVIRVQKSVWLIYTPFESKLIFQNLERFIDKDDELFVCPLDFADLYHYSTSPDVVKWLEKHIYIVRELSQKELHQL